MKYNVFRQIAVLRPHAYETSAFPFGFIRDWISSRVIELVYTAHDMAPMAQDCGYRGPPFRWDEARRSEIRCELDAAFFHLYLPGDSNGEWRLANGEARQQLTALKHHFPKPRDAVAHILDQFPIIRDKEENPRAFGRYRTKERVLEIYDAMLDGQRTGQPYRTRLYPPPGQDENR